MVEGMRGWGAQASTGFGVWGFEGLGSVHARKELRNSSKRSAMQDFPHQLFVLPSTICVLSPAQSRRLQQHFAPGTSRHGGLRFGFRVAGGGPRIRLARTDYEVMTGEPHIKEIWTDGACTLRPPLRSDLGTSKACKGLESQGLFGGKSG